MLNEAHDVLTVMRDALGEDVGTRAVEACQSAIVSSAGGAQLNAAGHPIRYTATMEFRGPARRADTGLVRRACALLLRIAGWMSLEGDGRTGSFRQGAALAIGRLARLTGLSDRTLTRLLTLFRVGGLLDVWQPPPESKAPKGSHSGHCFAMYRFAQGLPGALRAKLAAAAGRPRSTQRVTPPSSTPATERAAEAGEAYDTRQGMTDDVRAFLQARGLAPPRRTT